MNAMYSANVLIFGGGRWARVIAVVLDQLLEKNAKIQMYSPGNSKNLKVWAKQSGLSQRINVFDKYPNSKDIKKNSLSFIANAAKDHFSAAVFCLYHKIPTLVEKPFAMTVSDVDFLINLSKQNNTPIYSGHVFLFAKYIRNFSDKTKSFGVIKEINIQWLDPLEENRYGEQKRYDHKITVLHDVFPHIASIIRFFSDKKISYKGMVAERGGSLIKLKLDINNIKSNVIIARNADKRQRIVEVKTDLDSAVLDFSTEPGSITINGKITNACSDWESSNKPLYSMLQSFFDVNLNPEKNDDRLSPAIAKNACEIIELGFKDYRKILLDLLQAEKKSISDENITYILNELTGIKRKTWAH